MDRHEALPRGVFVAEANVNPGQVDHRRHVHRVRGQGGLERGARGIDVLQAQRRRTDQVMEHGIIRRAVDQLVGHFRGAGELLALEKQLGEGQPEFRLTGVTGHHVFQIVQAGLDVAGGNPAIGQPAEDRDVVGREFEGPFQERDRHVVPPLDGCRLPDEGEDVGIVGVLAAQRLQELRRFRPATLGDKQFGQQPAAVRVIEPEAKVVARERLSGFVMPEQKVDAGREEQVHRIGGVVGFVVIGENERGVVQRGGRPRFVSQLAEDARLEVGCLRIERRGLAQLLDGGPGVLQASELQKHAGPRPPGRYMTNVAFDGAVVERQRILEVLADPIDLALHVQRLRVRRNQVQGVIGETVGIIDAPPFEGQARQTGEGIRGVG